MRILIRVLLLATLAVSPLHAQAGCGRLDAASITQVIHRQRLATDAGRFIDDGGGVCRVTFGGDTGPVQVVVIRLELGDVATVRGSMQAGQGGGTGSRALAGVGDEAFVTANPSGDGAAAEVRDGTTLVMVQVLTQRGTKRARTAAAADVARLLFGRAAVEPAASATVASAPRPVEPDVAPPDPPVTPGNEPRVSDDDPSATEPEAENAPTPIAIPPYAEGPGDVCAALPSARVRALLADAGLAVEAPTVVKARGVCVYTFGPVLTDGAVRVTVQYAGAREPVTAARPVAALRRRPSARALGGVGDGAAVIAGGGTAVIAYRVGLFSGLVEVQAPAGSQANVTAGAERIARAWATRLADASRETSGGTR